MMKNNILAVDLDYIVQYTPSVWQEMRNKKIFITGGTGFIGTWLLETLAWANDKLNLNLAITVLTRDLKAFAKKAPHLVNNSVIQFQIGDVRNYNFSEENFSYFIHGATEASKHLNDTNPLLMLDTILEGTRQALKHAAIAKTEKFLLLSSGAIYGKQPSHLPHLNENYYSTSDNMNPSSAYAIGKFASEHMCLLHAKQSNTQIKIARCFAFVGPYLPIDIHFAVGNFIRDGLNNKDIFINSDGSSYRSYQYAADLVIWLLHILCHGKSCVPYNVGSDEPISILQLAQAVAKQFNPSPNITVAKKAQPNMLPERYVPSVQRANQELGLINRINLEEALQKTVNWHTHCHKNKN